MKKKSVCERERCNVQISTGDNYKLRKLCVLRFAGYSFSVNRRERITLIMCHFSWSCCTAPCAVCRAIFSLQKAKYLILFDGCECIYSCVFTLSLSPSLDLPTPIYNFRQGAMCTIFVLYFANVCDLPAVHFEPIIYSDTLCEEQK